MRGNRSIRQTLLRDLFLRPKVLDKKAYALARADFFPNETLFQRFLRASSAQERYPLARRILLDLAFFAECPPPNKLLLNLAESQEFDKPTAGPGDYVARDHFIHLVFLYLLGINFFVGHDVMHRRCAAELRKFRRDNVIREIVGVYKLFRIAWTHFVLFHDLGYPLERLSPENRSPQVSGSISDSRLRWIEPLREVGKYFSRDTGARALARLVAARMLITPGHSTFEEMFINPEDWVTVSESTRELMFDGLDEENAEYYRSLLSNWLPAISLPNISGARDLGLLRSCIPSLKLIAVVEDRHGEASLTALQTEKGYEWVVGPKWSENSSAELQAFYTSTSAESLLRDGYKGSDLKIHYFATKPEELFLRDTRIFFPKPPLDKRANASRSNSKKRQPVQREIFDQFIEVVDYFRSLSDSREALLKEIDCGEYVAANVYVRILESQSYVEPTEPQRTIDRAQQRLARIAKSIDKVLPSLSRIFSESVSKILEKEIEADLATYRDLLEAGEGPAFEKLWQTLLKKQEEIESTIQRTVQREIVDPMRLEGCIKSVREVFSALVKDDVTNCLPKDVFAVEHGAIGETTTTSELLSRTPASCEELDRYFSRRGFPSFGSFVAVYAPSHFGERASYYFDHGIASALTLRAVVSLMSRIIETFREAQSPYLSVAFGLGDDPRSANRKREALLLLGEMVEGAIAMHNIYPASVAGSGDLRTSLSRHPFEFLAFLADALQRWDRVPLVNQATSSGFGYLSPESFDIQIEDRHFLKLWIQGTSGDIEKERRAANSLSHYLEEAGQLLMFETIETK